MAILLQTAIDLAVNAHRSDEDPPGEPYIVHPMRVMLAVSQADDAHQDERLRCVAILHDVMEHASVTAAALAEAGMPRSVIKAVKLLTHDASEPYADYVIRLKPDSMARTVKIADLLDNADLRRVTFRPRKAKDLPRVIRYAAAYKYLTDQISRKEFLQLMKHGENPPRRKQSAR